MNRIGKFQFISMMLINDAFVLFCLTGSISLVTAAGFVVGSIIQLLLTFPLVRLYSKGKKLRDCGRLAEFIAAVSMISWGGLLFSMLWNAGELVFVPFEGLGKWSRLLITGLLAAVCVYISSCGIKALARSSAAAAAAGVICLITAAVSAVVQSDISNIQAAADETGLFREIVKGIALSGGMSGAAVMLEYVKDDVRSTAVGYFAGKAVVSAVMLTVGVLVCDGIMDITERPIASAAQLSQPFSVQRIDSLFLIIFTVFAAFSIAVQAAAADIISGELFPKLKKFRCSIILGAMALTGAAFGGEIHYSLPFAAAAMLTVTAAPVLYYVRRKYFASERNIAVDDRSCDADRLRLTGKCK